MPRREHLRTLGASAEFQGLGVDPDGRDFFIIWGDRIERYGLTGDAPGQVVADPACGFDFTHLDGLTPFQSSVHGRVYYGEVPPEIDSPFDFALFDRENDGVIDELRIVDRKDRGDMGPVWNTVVRDFGYR